MASANDLIVLFLGLETLSIALYVLAASHRRRSRSQESGIKYFVLGGFSSAFFLYGIALLYGAHRHAPTSARSSPHFQDTVDTQREDALVLAGVALLLVGLGFKVAAVPFHLWTPDVYQGAPTPVTAFMASAGKAAAFAAMLRVLVVALPFHRDDWRPVVWVLAVLSLVVGSVARRRADQRQAHARVLVDQSRRVRAHRCRGRRTSRRRTRPRFGDAERGDVPARVLGPRDRFVRRRRARRTRARWRLEPRVVQGSRGAPADAGDRAHRVPPRSGGRAVDERLRRQVRRHPRRGRGTQLRDRHHRHGRRRDRRLLVPADHGQRLARTGRRRSRSSRCRSRRGSRSRVPPCSRSSSASGPAGSSTPPTPSPNTPADPSPQRFCLRQTACRGV